MKTILRLLALVAGVYVGFRFPDIDQRTDLLVHRSIITHGLLAPLLLYAVLGSRRSPAPARLFVAGAALGVVASRADPLAAVWLDTTHRILGMDRAQHRRVLLHRPQDRAGLEGNCNGIHLQCCGVQLFDTNRTFAVEATRSGDCGHCYRDRAGS